MAYLATPHPTSYSYSGPYLQCCPLPLSFDLYPALVPSTPFSCPLHPSLAPYLPTLSPPPGHTSTPPLVLVLFPGPCSYPPFPDGPPCAAARDPRILLPAPAAAAALTPPGPHARLLRPADAAAAKQRLPNASGAPQRGAHARAAAARAASRGGGQRQWGVEVGAREQQQQQ